MKKKQCWKKDPLGEKIPFFPNFFLMFQEEYLYQKCWKISAINTQNQEQKEQKMEEK